MKKGKILGILAVSAALLTGCVDSMPDLTANEAAMISEYAAGLLLKYSRNYDYKIVSEEEVAAARAAEQEKLENSMKEESEADQNQTQSDETNENENLETQPPKEQSQEVQVIEASADTDFAAELGIDDVILKYQSFEVCDSYPKEIDGFQVDAAQNKRLLVVHFDLEGSPEKDLECNLFDYSIKCRFNINEVVVVNALNTMLPNELIFYMDTIHAGDIVDVVIVAEINEITQEDITSLTINLSSNNGSCVAKLK